MNPVATWLTATVGLSLVPVTSLAQNPPTRVVTGTVVGSITREPVSGAFILIEGTAVHAVAAEGGRFKLLAVPTTPVVLRAQYIGYRPGQLALDAGADSIDVSLPITEPRPHSPVTGAFPALSPSEMRAIWAALLRGLGHTADAMVEHLQDVGRAVPNSGITAPSGPARVVLRITPGSSRELEDSTWHRDLLSVHWIDGVCRSAEASLCPFAGFKLYVTPDAPGQFAEDSVTVSISYTAIDARECKRGRGMGDSGSESHFVVRRGGEWRYAGTDDSAGQMIGGIYCGGLR